MKVFNIILFFVLAIALSSCNELTPKEYLQWLESDDSGLVKEKTVGGLKIKVKYLPVDYLVYKDIKALDLGNSVSIKDSIRNFYKNGYHFLMTLTPSVENGADIMLSGINSFQEFSQRVQQMNFEFQNFLELKDKQNTTSPVLCSLENVYGLKEGRSINVVFVDEEGMFDSSKEISFVFDDRVFKTGTSVFNFKRSDIENTPVIKM